MTFRTRLAAIAVAALAVAGAGVATAAPAYADAGVSVTVEGHPELTAVADPAYITELRVSGSGFQSIKNGYGGIYVAFGWVDDGWRPSQGGATGTDYRYVPDDESAPTGYISFVAFPGSSTAYAANGGTLAADGTWSTVLTVPGARFTSLDREGNPTEVNCLEVQCGVITIGAHGLKNANNETFTPVSFRDLYSAAPTPAATAVAAPAPTPAPTQTTYVVEEAAAAASPASDQSGLVQGLLWGAAGIGVLAIGAIVFLVWAVLSSRRRHDRPAGGDGAAS
jgi:hypothetical protein